MYCFISICIINFIIFYLIPMLLKSGLINKNIKTCSFISISTLILIYVVTYNIDIVLFKYLFIINFLIFFIFLISFIVDLFKCYKKINHKFSSSMKVEFKLIDKYVNNISFYLFFKHPINSLIISIIYLYNIDKNVILVNEYTYRYLNNLKE